MKLKSGLWITYTAVVSALLLLYVLVQTNKVQNTWRYGNILEYVSWNSAKWRNLTDIKSTSLSSGRNDDNQEQKYKKLKQKMYCQLMI